MYFADPELPVNAAHVERLQRELRFNVDVEIAWGESFEAADHRPLARLIDCQTLIIVGEHDFICGPVWNRALADAIPHARYEVVADAGHLPQYEQPERVLAIIEEWLRGQGTPN
jgi:proline iminopeptidase